MKARLLPIFLALVVQAEAVFVPPDEFKPLFQRDALPIDADLMRELSEALTTLARRPLDGDPAQERASAQLLAMASRLNPANRRSRDISRQLAAGEEVAPAPAGEFGAARARSWDLTSWLLSEDAGPAGRLVGQQLVDALRVVDPGHPGVKSHQAAGEHQRWNGVVAPLNRFRKRVERPAPTPQPEPEPPEPSPPPVPKPPAPPIRLAEAQILTPFEVLVGQSRKVALVPLSLRVTESPDHGDLELSFLPPARNEAALEAVDASRTRILGALSGKWGRLPEHQLATLENFGNVAYSSRNGAALSGPASLLLSSAISGTPLRKNLIFLGEVAPDGTIHAPDLGWDYLRTLRDGTGGRLIVPTSFEPQIRALLAMEEPDFFIRYEVVAVRTLDQALRMAATTPDSEAQAVADQEFARFRQVTAPANIGPLAVNKHVRERLDKILSVHPGHLSAKMILLQGSSRRPTRLDRATLGLEIRRCLEPMTQIFGNGVDTSQLHAADLETAFDACRRRLDPLDSYVDRSDRQLHAKALQLVDMLRTMDGILKSDDGASEDPLATACVELRDRHAKLLRSFQSPGPPPVDQERKN